MLKYLLQGFASVFDVGRNIRRSKLELDPHKHARQAGAFDSYEEQVLKDRGALEYDVAKAIHMVKQENNIK